MRLIFVPKYRVLPDMKPISKTPRGPPKPACNIRGEFYFDVPTAARTIEVVSESTLRRWAVNGWTSFGFPLDVIRRNGHLLIPEESVGIVEEFLKQHPLPRPGTPANVRAAFREEARLTFNLIAPRSSYSRARSPRPPRPVPR